LPNRSTTSTTSSSFSATCSVDFRRFSTATAATAANTDASSAQRELNEQSQKIWNLFLQGQKHHSLANVPAAWWHSVLNLWRIWSSNAEVEKYVETAFEEMRQTAKRLDVQSYEIVVDMYLHRTPPPVTHASLRKALGVLQLMKIDKVKPSTSLLNDILEAHLQLKQRKEADELRTQIKRPSTRTFNILLRAATSKNEVETLIAEMKANGVRNNSETERLLYQHRYQNPESDQVTQILMKQFPEVTKEDIDRLAHLKKLTPTQYLQRLKEQGASKERIEAVMQSMKRILGKDMSLTLKQEIKKTIETIQNGRYRWSRVEKKCAEIERERRDLWTLSTLVQLRKKPSRILPNR
jgi:hypothetical protein